MPIHLASIPLPGEGPLAETVLRVRDAICDALPWRYFASEDGGRIVTRRDDAIVAVTAAEFAATLQHHTSFTRTDRDGNVVQVPLPRLVTEAMIHNPQPGLWWPLKGVVRHPFLAPDGHVVVAPGYDVATARWIHWDGPAPDPDSLSADDVRAVWERLLDFGFDSLADVVHAMGLYLCPFVRPAIEGPTPLHLIESIGSGETGTPGAGVGKTYLAELVGLVALGRAPDVRGLDTWASEARRQLNSYLLGVPEYLFLDNLPTDYLISLPELHLALTATGPVYIRPVGSGTERGVPVRCTWVATANGPDVDSEQARRTIPIRLRPLRRRPYKTPDLSRWVKNNRDLVVSAILWTIQRWVDVGRPKPPRTLPSYTRWSDIVGGIVAHYGREVAGGAWLAPSHRPRPRAERDWQALYEGWPRVNPDSDVRRPLAPAAVVGLVESLDLVGLRRSLPTGSSARSLATMMGSLLKRRENIACGDWRLLGRHARDGRVYWPERREPAPDPERGTCGTSAVDVPSENPLSSLWVAEPAEPAEPPKGGHMRAGLGACEGVSEGSAGSGGSASVDSAAAFPAEPGAEPRGWGSAEDFAAWVHDADWQSEVAEMALRGVRIDPAAWEDAVAALREEYWYQREGSDEALALQADDRLTTLSTYAEDVLSQAWADPGHRVRAFWDPDGTWTGRITAKAPPLQAITKKGGLRRAVVPAPGCRFVVGDWSQSQLRIVAGLSRDPTLCRALAPGRDPHLEIGERIAPGSPGARDLGKVMNFSILYLAGVDALVESATERGIELSPEDAGALRDGVRAAYPRLAAWQREQEGRCAFESPLGRAVVIPAARIDLRTGRPQLPAVLAGIAQAAEADALRAVLGRSPSVMDGLDARIVLTVHDEVLWEVAEADASEAARRAKTLLEAALGWVCAPCPAAATVDVRDSWAKGAP